jgi:hypothetical protein
MQPVMKVPDCLILGILALVATVKIASRIFAQAHAQRAQKSSGTEVFIDQVLVDSSVAYCNLGHFGRHLRSSFHSKFLQLLLSGEA